MNIEGFDKESFNKKQDWFLEELNRLGGLPIDTKYEATRPIITVSNGTYREMQYLANMYVHFIQDETPADVHIKYNPTWLYTVIKKYYNLEGEENL